MINLIDILTGRKKIVDERIKLQRVKELLSKLKEDVEIKIKWHDWLDSGSLDATSKAMTEVINCLFIRVGEGRHTIYETKNSEKHYIELSKGYLKIRIGEEVFEERPFRRATISYTIRK